MLGALPAKSPLVVSSEPAERAISLGYYKGPQGLELSLFPREVVLSKAGPGPSRQNAQTYHWGETKQGALGLLSDSGDFQTRATPLFSFRHGQQTYLSWVGVFPATVVSSAPPVYVTSTSFSSRRASAILSSDQENAFQQLTIFPDHYEYLQRGPSGTTLLKLSGKVVTSDMVFIMHNGRPYLTLVPLLKKLGLTLVRPYHSPQTLPLTAAPLSSGRYISPNQKYFLYKAGYFSVFGPSQDSKKSVQLLSGVSKNGQLTQTDLFGQSRSYRYPMLNFSFGGRLWSSYGVSLYKKVAVYTAEEEGQYIQLGLKNGISRTLTLSSNSQMEIVTKRGSTLVSKTSGSWNSQDIITVAYRGAMYAIFTKDLLFHGFFYSSSGKSVDGTVSSVPIVHGSEPKTAVYSAPDGRELRLGEHIFYYGRLLYSWHSTGKSFTAQPLTPSKHAKLSSSFPLFNIDYKGSTYLSYDLPLWIKQKPTPFYEGTYLLSSSTGGNATGQQQMRVDYDGTVTRAALFPGQKDIVTGHGQFNRGEYVLVSFRGRIYMVSTGALTQNAFVLGDLARPISAQPLPAAQTVFYKGSSLSVTTSASRLVVQRKQNVLFNKYITPGLELSPDFFLGAKTLFNITALGRLYLSISPGVFSCSPKGACQLLTPSSLLPSLPPAARFSRAAIDGTDVNLTSPSSPERLQESFLDGSALQLHHGGKNYLIITPLLLRYGFVRQGAEPPAF